MEKIAFNIEEQYTDELHSGRSSHRPPGVQGERTIKTEFYTSNGQELARQGLYKET